MYTCGLFYLHRENNWGLTIIITICLDGPDVLHGEFEKTMSRRLRDTKSVKKLDRLETPQVHKCLQTMKIKCVAILGKLVTMDTSSRVIVNADKPLLQGRKLR